MTTLGKVGRQLKNMNMNPTAIRVYYFIQGYWKENGCGPSYKEIRDFLGQVSTSNAQVYVDKLISNGYLTIGHRKDKTRRVSGSMRITDKRPEWYDMDKSTGSQQ